MTHVLDVIGRLERGNRQEREDAAVIRKFYDWTIASTRRRALSHTPRFPQWPDEMAHLGPTEECPLCSNNSENTQMSKPTSEITGVEVVEPRGADQRMSTPMQFCNRMEKHTALWWRLLRSADLLALTRVVRAASTVIGTDADHGLVLEPEMAEAMDNLAIALDALPGRGRRII